MNEQKKIRPEDTFRTDRSFFLTLHSVRQRLDRRRDAAAVADEFFGTER